MGFAEKVDIDTFDIRQLIAKMVTKEIDDVDMIFVTEIGVEVTVGISIKLVKSKDGTTLLDNEKPEYPIY